ncbi:uncharacterized protein [Cebidichthys violaceus]|uniref:uncharacterized protein n=1 Tax=Cebidichthys violaceus TaxID=271503 RepID=UPI0035CC0EF3
MVMSSGSTVFYLCGHMRRMVANGQPLSCPQLRNQVRVTVTGILQGVLYVFCASWTIFSSFPGGGYTFTDSTVINLYMSGTLFNLGAVELSTREEDTRTANRVKMDFQTFALINGSLVFLNIVTIAFYMFCMVRPLHGGRIKQPLKLLLWSLICFTITYMVSGIAVAFSHLLFNSFKITQILSVVSVCSVFNSMTSSVWLNFFYCIQIVPAQRAPFIWIKKNVKSIIYCFWITERLYSLFDFTSMILANIPLDGIVSSNYSTVVHDMPAKDPLHIMFFIVFSILKAHFVFCLCVMVMSSGSTVFYLCGHMRRMVANGQPLSCPQLRNQVRVTVTGILQGVLYVFCAVWTLFRSYPGGGLYKFSNVYTDSTVINLYMSGTLFTLGAGQAVFRQRAAHIWLRAAQCCKAPQVQQSEQGV